MGVAAAPPSYISLAPLKHAVNMKIVFLLALAGLASCRSILPGGDQARNVELEYTYIDEHGQPIRVKVQTDLINLSGIREVELKNPEPVTQHVFVPAPAPAPVPKPEYRFVVVEPPKTKTIEVEVPKPEVRTVFVQGPAPIPFGRKIELQAPEPEIVYVQAPEPKTEEVKKDVPVQTHRFVVPAPTTRAVKFEAPEPEIKHFLLPTPTFRTLQTKTPINRRISTRKSFDEDDFGSA